MENKEVELGFLVDSESYMGIYVVIYVVMLEYEDSVVSSVSNVIFYNEDVVSLNSEDRLLVKFSEFFIDIVIEADEDLDMQGDLIKGISDRSQSQFDLKDSLKENDIMVKFMLTDFEVITDFEVYGVFKIVEDLFRKYKGNYRNCLRDGMVVLFVWNMDVLKLY